MGNKELAAGANGVQEGKKDTYTVLSFSGKDLPAPYKNMVLSKWMRSYRNGNDFIRLTDSDGYYRAYERYINFMLQRPDAIIRLAVLSDDHDIALGWSLVERDILHYVFVQHEQRNNGIGKMLVPKGIKYFTHLTRDGLKIWNNIAKNVIFDPFL